VVTETGRAGLVERLRAAATALEFGPVRVAGVLAGWLSAGPGSLGPELLSGPVHVHGTDVLTRPRHTCDPDTGSASPFRPPFAEPARS
jgi:hypothetical protein